MNTPVVMTIEVFGNLIREHQASLRAFVRSLGAHPDWVDDIAQEAFLTAWKKIGEFSAEKDFGKWLRGIARNILLNERSKETRRARILSEHLTEILDTNYTEAECLTPEGHQRLLEALRDCMSQLPPKSAALLQQRYQENIHASEIATRVGVKPEAVRQNLIRVRRKIKECIQEKVGGAVP